MTGQHNTAHVVRCKENGKVFIYFFAQTTVYGFVMFAVSLQVQVFKGKSFPVLLIYRLNVLPFSL